MITKERIDQAAIAIYAAELAAPKPHAKDAASYSIEKARVLLKQIDSEINSKLCDETGDSSFAPKS